MKEEIGYRIKIIRKSMNLTQEGLASHLGISSQYLGAVEKGKYILAIDKLEILCNLANVSSDYILFGKINNFNDKSKDLLQKFSKKQIEDGCEMLKALAYYIQEN